MLFKQITEAIFELHKNNTAHRDIKPENILITEDQKTVKMIDFGTSKTLSGKKTTTILGAVGYMPLEMIEQKGPEGYDAFAGDVWSLSILLH